MRYVILISTTSKGKKMNTAGTHYIYRIELNTRFFEMKGVDEVDACAKAKQFVQKNEKMTKIVRISEELSNDHKKRGEQVRERLGIPSYWDNLKNA